MSTICKKALISLTHNNTVFLGGSDGKASACNAGDPGSIPGSGRSPPRRKWHPTPVLSPGKSHGWRSLVGYSPCGHKESDMTEQLHFHIICSQNFNIWPQRKFNSTLNFPTTNETVTWFTINEQWRFVKWMNKWLKIQKVYSSLVATSCSTLATPRTTAHQAPLSMGFPRQEYWSGLPFPSPGELPDPGTKPRSPELQADSLLTELQGKPKRGLWLFKDLTIGGKT